MCAAPYYGEPLINLDPIGDRTRFASAGVAGL
jgi:hypothetical protein